MPAPISETAESSDAFDDYAEPNGPALAAYARRHLALIASEDLTAERRLVAEKIIHLSLDARRSVARLPDQTRLCIITGLDKSDVSRGIRDLIRARIIEHWQAHGETYFRLLLSADLWVVGWRQSDARARQLAIDTEAWLFANNEAAPRARELPLPPEPPDLNDALSAISREAALKENRRGLHSERASSELPCQQVGRTPQDITIANARKRPCRPRNIGTESKAGGRALGVPTATTSDAPGLPSVPTSETAPSSSGIPPAETPVPLDAIATAAKSGSHVGQLSRSVRSALYSRERTSLPVGFAQPCDPLSVVGWQGN